MSIIVAIAYMVLAVHYASKAIELFL